MLAGTFLSAEISNNGPWSCSAVAIDTTVGRKRTDERRCSPHTVWTAVESRSALDVSNATWKFGTSDWGRSGKPPDPPGVFVTWIVERGSIVKFIVRPAL